MSVAIRSLACVVLMAVALPAVTAGEVARRPLEDNSFLLEEAYNQEAGVVQQIGTFLRGRGGAWVASFTQEWPVPGIEHPLSYTLTCG